MFGAITKKVMKTLNKMKFKVNTAVTQSLVISPYARVAKQKRKVPNNPINITKEIPDHFSVAEYTRFSRITEYKQNNIK